MSTWNCENCDLTNSLQNTYCQACFNHIPITAQSNENNTPELSLTPQPFVPFVPITSNENQMDNINDINVSNTSNTLNTLSLSDIMDIMGDSSMLPSTALIGPNGTRNTTKHNNKFDSKSNVSPEIINRLMTKQRILFYGFLRFEQICEITDCDNYNTETLTDCGDLMFIPSDIMKLSLAFFELNIRFICDRIHFERAAIYSMTSQVNIIATVTYDDLYELAMVLRGQKDCFIAYELMNELINRKPLLSEYQNAMGLILKRWNEFDRAELHYKKAIIGEPKENIYKWNYGLLLQETQKYKDALQQFLNASENSDAKQPDYIFEAAYCYQKLNDFKNATVNYLKAIEIQPSKSTYWIYYAEYLCEELKQYGESIKCFETAIQLENECNINYYYRFARYLRDFHQNYKLSKIYYLKCLSMNKKIDKNGKLMEIKGVNGSFGYLLFLMGEYKKADKYLSLAQTTDPKNAWTFFYYGLLNISYFKNKNKANQLLNKAVQCCTTNVSIKKHLKRITDVDPNNMQYHNKFESLLNQKFAIESSKLD